MSICKECYSRPCRCPEDPPWGWKEQNRKHYYRARVNVWFFIIVIPLSMVASLLFMEILYWAEGTSYIFTELIK